MYRFEWRQLLTDSFLQRLSAVGSTAGNDLDEIGSLLSRIFEGVGGSPFADSDWEAEHRARVAGLLLGDAVRAVLIQRYGFRGPIPGVVVRDVDGELLANDAERVDVNRASRPVLESLPIIGPALARRIELERRHGGSFHSMSDLLRRVKGLGDEAAKGLAGVLDFAVPEERIGPRVTGTLEDDLGMLLSRTDPGPGRQSLAAALEEVVLYVAAHPHPFTRLDMKRDDLEPDTVANRATAPVSRGRIGVLADGAYYPHVAGLLETARERVDVCMFYIALPTADHPTHRLLEALTRRVAAGCAVRVLVDQDRKDDPYRSRVINAKAVEYLLSHGVEVKGDPTEKLLHSKFVVIDGATVVIGSHNWTAGSFFRYADLSTVISGPEACGPWRTRFDELWAGGSTF